MYIYIYIYIYTYIYKVYIRDAIRLRDEKDTEESRKTDAHPLILYLIKILF